MAPKQTKSLGRYDEVGRARPLQHVPDIPPSLNIRTAIGAAPSPGDGRRDQVVINRRVDVLEDERSHGRISESAFREGRHLQEIFELRNKLGPAAPGGGGSSLGADQKASGMHERLADLIDRTSAEIVWIEKILGQINSRLMRRLLGERMSYADCAALRGRNTGERGIYHIAETFRESLEALANAKSATGPDRPAHRNP